MSLDDEKKRKLRIVGIIGVIFFVYLFVFPLFWPKPQVKVNIPKEVKFGEDPEVTITVTSVHSNFQIYHAYAIINRNESTSLEKTNQSLLTMTLYQKKKIQEWGYWSVNRFTCPQKKEIKIKIPVREAEMKGEIKPGTVKGFIRVEMSYVRLGKYNRVYMGGYRGKNLGKKVDFEFKIKK